MQCSSELMTAPGRECHTMSERKKDGENTGEVEARKRRQKRLKRGWLFREENRVNDKMKVSDDKEVTGGKRGGK